MDLVENLIVEFPNGKVELSVLELGIAAVSVVALGVCTYFLSKRIDKITVNKNTGLEIDFAK